MLLTYKYRIKDRSARRMLRQHATAVNHVWNYCNSLQKEVETRYRAGSSKNRWPSNFDLNLLTSGTSKELGIHAQSINETCKQYAKSRDAARSSIRFRSSFGPRRSLGWVPFRRKSIQIDGGITYLGKTFRLFGIKRRPMPEEIRTGAFVEDARGRWYVTLQCEVDRSLPAGNGAIGIDLGLKTLATCSNGDTVPALRHYRQYEAALATAQRAGNRCRIKAIHAKVANARRDQSHKATAKIARENSLIVIGNVNAAQLKKTRMGKSISDASWTMFRNQLCYKARRHNAVFIEVDERWTSQTCSDCGVVGGPKGTAGLGIRRWECQSCGTSHDRDINAAQNILRAGLSAQPRADGSRLNTDKHELGVACTPSKL